MNGNPAERKCKMKQLWSTDVSIGSTKTVKGITEKQQSEACKAKQQEMEPQPWELANSLRGEMQKESQPQKKGNGWQL